MTEQHDCFELREKPFPWRTKHTRTPHSTALGFKYLTRPAAFGDSMHVLCSLCGRKHYVESNGTIHRNDEPR